MNKEQTAEKLEIKKAEEKDGKETITFSTDGFSDYLFAVTKEKETEKQSESETVKETEVPATEVETTAPETKEPETVTSETTASQIAVQEGEIQAQQADLTLTVQSVGTDKTDSKRFGYPRNEYCRSAKCGACNNNYADYRHR